MHVTLQFNMYSMFKLLCLCSTFVEKFLDGEEILFLIKALNCPTDNFLGIFQEVETICNSQEEVATSVSQFEWVHVASQELAWWLSSRESATTQEMWA